MKKIFFHPTSSFYPPTGFCHPALRPSCFSLCCSTTEVNIIGIIIARILRRVSAFSFRKKFISKILGKQYLFRNGISSLVVICDGNGRNGLFPEFGRSKNQKTGGRATQTQITKLYKNVTITQIIIPQTHQSRPHKCKNCNHSIKQRK